MIKKQAQIKTDKLQSSTDWPIIEQNLRSKLNRLRYQGDLKKLIKNVSISVTKLSRAEVENRRSRSNRSKELLDKVNGEITLIEEYLLVATLIGEQ